VALVGGCLMIRSERLVTAARLTLAAKNLQYDGEVRVGGHGLFTSRVRPGGRLDADKSSGS
jgi:hypothetical protein